jgi:putative Ca2+/H+ antiporter (TMEM165/GDT1 family)
MDLKVAATAFAALFLAELGDKTQLAAIAMAVSTKKPLSVFVGGAAALAAVTGIGVVFGEALVRAVPELYLRRAAAALFVAMGGVLWFKG